MKRLLLISVIMLASALISIQGQTKINPKVISPVFSGKTKAIRDVLIIIPPGSKMLYVI